MNGICSLCRSKKAALASLNSGNKKVALRHAKALKLASESREKCISFLNRVEEVLSLIANAESTKKVILAIKQNFLHEFMCIFSFSYWLKLYLNE